MGKEKRNPNVFRDYFDRRKDSFSIFTILACLDIAEQAQNRSFGNISRDRTSSMMAESLKLEANKNPKIIGFAKIIEGETSQVVLSPHNRRLEASALLLNPQVDEQQLESGVCIVEVSFFIRKFRYIRDKVQVVVDDSLQVTPLDLVITKPLSEKLGIGPGEEIFLSNLRTQ